MVEPKIEVSMIVKNESSCIEQCLDSLKGVDYITIVDTGSIDNTVELCKKYTPYVYSGEQYKWRDSFQFSRNQSLDLCSHGDYILIMDADEYLEFGGIERIRNLIKNNPQQEAFKFECVSQKNNNCIHYLTLLFKKLPHIRWCGDIHNYLSITCNFITNIKVYYGYSDAHNLDPDRALRILKKIVDENPDVKREKYYLAREYYYRKDYETAIKIWEDYTLVSSFSPELADAYLYLARCYLAKSQYSMARKMCLYAININANFKEAWKLFASLSFEKNAKVLNRIADEIANNEDVLFIRN
jgi:glycosyltransferase involved in cell wall biosynthesis